MVSISLLIICLFNMHMFNIQHKEHVQISHVSYIRKPRLSGHFPRERTCPDKRGFTVLTP